MEEDWHLFFPRRNKDCVPYESCKMTKTKLLKSKPIPSQFQCFPCNSVLLSPSDWLNLVKLSYTCESASVSSLEKKNTDRNKNIWSHHRLSQEHVLHLACKWVTVKTIANKNNSGCFIHQQHAQRGLLCIIREHNVHMSGSNDAVSRVKSAKPSCCFLWKVVHSKGFS